MKKKIAILVTIFLLLCILFGAYTYATKDWEKPVESEEYHSAAWIISDYFRANPSLSLEDWGGYLKQTAEEFNSVYDDISVKVEQNKIEYHETLYHEKDMTVQFTIDIVLYDKDSLPVNTDAATFEDAVNIKNFKRAMRNKYGIKMPFVCLDARGGKGDGFNYYNTPMMREKDENGQYTDNYQFYMIVEFDDYIAQISVVTDELLIDPVMYVYGSVILILDENGISFFNEDETT